MVSSERKFELDKQTQQGVHCSARQEDGGGQPAGSLDIVNSALEMEFSANEFFPNLFSYRGIPTGCFFTDKHAGCVLLGR